MRLLLSSAAALGLGVVLVLAAACNPEAYSVKTNTNAPQPLGSPVPAPPAPQADNIRRVTVDELRQALADNKAVVVDVRGEAAYKSGHIKGARLMPAAEIDKHVDELPKDKLIVTYCS